jgi:plasmid stabilization system protein ParE
MNLNYNTIIKEQAQNDLKEAVKWYNLQKIGLGKRFLNQVREKTGILKQNPFLCQVRYSQIRTAIVDQFPYLIHYYIDENQKTIVIIAVLHSARKPDLWDERNNRE